MLRVITVLSDFGTADGYLGAMKGVIRSISPQTNFDDISAEIDPGDIFAASLAIENYHNRYPEGTVHLAVIDPGVGSSRKGICLECENRFYVGPDNGIFEAVLGSGKDYSCYELANPEYRLENVSETFHGRDIFAPAAAYLSTGVKPAEFGPLVQTPTRLSESVSCIVSEDGLSLIGSVTHADRFGNLITSISRGKLDVFTGGDNQKLTIHVSGKMIDGISQYYSQVEVGEYIALFGSSGKLEIAVNGGSALKALGEQLNNLSVTIYK